MMELEVDINQKAEEVFGDCLPESHTFFFNGRRIEDSDTFAQLRVPHYAEMLAIRGGEKVGKPKFWMRGKRWEGGWDLDNYREEAMIFIPRRWVWIQGFLWDKRTNGNGRFGLKYRIKIDDQEPGEYFEPDVQSWDDLI